MVLVKKIPFRDLRTATNLSRLLFPPQQCLLYLFIWQPFRFWQKEKSNHCVQDRKYWESIEGAVDSEIVDHKGKDPYEEEIQEPDPLHQKSGGKTLYLELDNQIIIIINSFWRLRGNKIYNTVHKSNWQSER